MKNIRSLGFALLVMLLGGCSSEPTYDNETSPDSPAHGVPSLSPWEKNMEQWGQHWGEFLTNNQNDKTALLNAAYYDAQRVFFQIADYTGHDEPWLSYARAAEKIYREDYCIPNKYRTAGWQRFPHGLFEDWRRTGDKDSKEAVLRLREDPPFSNIELGEHAEKWRSSQYSREIAYAISAQLTAERAGAPRQQQRLDAFVDAALNHLYEWRTGRFLGADPNRHFRQPFMFGLTAEALIEYYHTTGDARIVPALSVTADWFWTNMWIDNADGQGNGAFMYLDRDLPGVGKREPAPDLNLLIAPVYGWLYLQTGTEKYREQGDAIFSGGVQRACLKCSGKIFNQNYRWSFDYVRWRQEAERRWRKGT